VKTRSVTETAILSASVLIALIVLIVGASRNVHGKPAAIVITGVIILAGTGMMMWFRQNSHASAAKSVPASGEEYWRLADECRRLAEMAVTAQEHTDLRLGEVAVQMDQMRAQLDSVRKILSEVE
jgi:uncharacterized protein HemX